MKGLFTWDEMSTILHVTRMYIGYPFIRTEKPPISDSKMAALNAIRERLLAARDTLGDWRDHPETAVAEVVFSEDEQELLRQALRACVAECANDTCDLWIHLRAENADTVNKVIEKLGEAQQDSPNNG